MHADWELYLTYCVCLAQGDMKPDDASSTLIIYEGKFTRLKEDRSNLIKAKEALELADPGEMSFLVKYF